MELQYHTKGIFKNSVGFSSANVKGDEIVQRPRLNLACHGDHIKNDMVFKEQKVQLLRKKISVAYHTKIS